MAINPLLTGIIGGIAAARRGESFWSGFGQGAVAGLLNIGLAFLGSAYFSIANAVAAGALGIYSRDEQGVQAFFLDHTVGQGTTAIGTVVAIVHLAGGGRFEAGLSRGSNAFILSNSPFSKSNSVGNCSGFEGEKY